MADLPVGATFGSLVHAVLEHADPEAPDLRAELLGHLDDQLVRWPVDLDRDQLADALVAVCDTPLGPLARTTLRQIPLRDRLRELDFELPLSGGDVIRKATGARLADLAPLLRRHLQEGDPVRAYAASLEQPALGDQSLRGYLTGSVDVVLRLPGPRYLVVDYKTNWLGGRTTHPSPPPPTVPRRSQRRWATPTTRCRHFSTPSSCTGSSLATARLRPRPPPRRRPLPLPPGDVRPGDSGRRRSPCGVFAWRPPAALVDELSDLLDGRVTP